MDLTTLFFEMQFLQTKRNAPLSSNFGFCWLPSLPLLAKADAPTVTSAVAESWGRGMDKRKQKPDFYTL